MGLNSMSNINTTVIIVNWNGRRFLSECLSALMEQTVKPLEIIVVDNASTDGSQDIVDNFPCVRLISLKENVGFAKGNNIAINSSSTKSEWIALLNPDAFADPRWLESLLQAALEHPTIDVFGSKLVNASNSLELDGIGDVYHISGLVWRRGHGMPTSSMEEVASEIFSPCAAGALYRKSALVAVGGFDEDFFCYTEDVDLGFRLRLAGYRCYYAPRSILYHVGSGITGGKNSNFSVYFGHRNLVWMFLKDMPGFLFWLLLPLHIVLNLVSIIHFSCSRQGEVILRAKRDAVFGFRKMWRKRRQIQRSRVVSQREIWRIMDRGLLPKKKW